MKPKKVSANRKRNQDIFKLTYLFIGLFVLLIGNFVYFMVFKSAAVINNSYNQRQDLLAKKYVRGRILSSNGTVLAETVKDSSGEEVRNYPYKDLFAHVVGRFQKGKTGLELAENFTLLTSHTNVFSQTVTELQNKKIQADDLVTTLNLNLQQVAYDALGSRKGAVVALEPSTGRVLAMVSKPSYDPNTILQNWEDLNNDSQNNSTFLNRAAQGLYAPGSTFKVVTLLEYIKENKDYEKYSYTCTGSGTFGDRDIQCYNREVHGTVDLKSSLAKSCNCSFAHIGTLLSLKSYNKTLNSLGFNNAVNFILPSNKSTFSLNDNSTINEIAQTAMGQGKTQITPLQNAMIASAIANGGKAMQPYLVEGVQTSAGDTVRKTKQKSAGTYMSEGQAEILKDYMTEVVNAGTASSLKSSAYQAAGKTGSAEYDSSGSSHAWFIGFAPAKNPQIAVSIIVESSGTGSQYAVPIAKKIFDTYLNK